MDTGMTEEKLIQAILQETRGSDDRGGLSSKELAQRVGICTESMRQILGKLKDKGKIQRVWAYRETLDGRHGRIPTYVWVEEENA